MRVLISLSLSLIAWGKLFAQSAFDSLPDGQIAMMHCNSANQPEVLIREQVVHQNELLPYVLLHEFAHADQARKMKGGCRAYGERYFERPVSMRKSEMRVFCINVAYLIDSKGFAYSEAIGEVALMFADPTASNRLTASCSLSQARAMIEVARTSYSFMFACESDKPKVCKVTRLTAPQE